jgi:HEAT repeat protein
MRKLNHFLAAGLLVLVASAPASAGRGSSGAQVRSAIKTGSPDVIISELERAERLICPSCIEPVLALVDHDDFRVREVAAWWIARRPAQRAELHDLAVARLYADDAILARNAADVLGTFRHPEALPVLGQAAGRQDFPGFVRAAALQAIGTIGHPAGLATVELAFADPAPEVRRAALRAYDGLRGEKNGLAIVALLADGDQLVRREATRMVGQAAPAAARVELERVLAVDADSFTRRNAAWSLGRIGDPASRAALESAALNDTSSLVRGVAKASLSRLR